MAEIKKSFIEYLLNPGPDAVPLAAALLEATGLDGYFDEVVEQTDAALATVLQAVTDTAAWRDLAQKWAAYPEDLPVSMGLYSALHYAAKAYASEYAAGQSEVAAIVAAERAVLAEINALTAVEVASPALIYDTYAAANAAVGSMPSGQVVRVLVDEEEDDAQTFYRKEGGALVLKLNTDALMLRVIRNWAPFAYGVDLGMKADADQAAGTGTDNAPLFLAALQTAYAAGKSTLWLPPGDLLFNDVTEWYNLTRGFHIRGDLMRATRIVLNFEGAEKVAWDFTRYDDTSSAGRPKHLEISDITFVLSGNVSEGEAPIAIKRLRCTDLRMFRVHATWNSGMWLVLSGVWNSIIQDCTVFGAGYRLPWASADAGTFTINATEDTITATGYVWPADPVGQLFRVGGDPISAFEIAERISDSVVRVTEVSMFTLTDKAGQWGSVRGTIADDSDQLELNADVMTAIDIGREFYLRKARSGATAQASASLGGTSSPRSQLFKVLAIDGTTITIEPAVTEAVTDGEIFCPAFDIRSENTAGIATNDFVMRDVNIEAFRGVALYMGEAINVHCDRIKLHGLNSATHHRRVSDHNAILERFTGIIRGDIEGAPLGAQIIVSDLVGTTKIDDITGAGTENMPFVHHENTNSYGTLVVGDVSRNNTQSQRTLDRIVTWEDADGPVPEVRGRVTAYRLNSTKPKLLPQRETHGTFWSALQSFVLGVTAKVQNGLEVIIYGNVPTLAGERVNGTPEAPEAVVSGNALNRFQGSGMAPDVTTMSLAGYLDIRAVSPVDDYVRGQMVIGLRKADGTVGDVWSFNATSIYPESTGTHQFGDVNFRLQSLYLNRLRLFPTADNTFFNDEMGFRRISNTQVALMLRGDDGTQREIVFTLA
jgi:hypothetical protein